MEKLKLTVRRANNSTSGNPRYQILDWDNQLLFEKIIKNGFIRDLKKGLFTRSDDSDCYSITNPTGIIIDKIRIVATVKY